MIMFKEFVSLPMTISNIKNVVERLTSAVTKLLFIPFLISDNF